MKKTKEVEDLAVVELLKEARIIKRQIGLFNNNLDKVDIKDLIQLVSILKILNMEIEKILNGGTIKINNYDKK